MANGTHTPAVAPSTPGYLNHLLNARTARVRNLAWDLAADLAVTVFEKSRRGR